MVWARSVLIRGQESECWPLIIIIIIISHQHGPELNLTSCCNCIVWSCINNLQQIKMKRVEKKTEQSRPLRFLHLKTRATQTRKCFLNISMYKIKVLRLWRFYSLTVFLTRSLQQVDGSIPAVRAAAEMKKLRGRTPTGNTYHPLIKRVWCQAEVDSLIISDFLPHLTGKHLCTCEDFMLCAWRRDHWRLERSRNKLHVSASSQ